MKNYEAILNRLVQMGWTVDRLPQPKPLPEEILKRYPAIPADYRELIESLGLVTSPERTAWLVTGGIISGECKIAFAWNEWEIQSLDAAGKDGAWATSIRQFWDHHFPLLMSVKSGYAYFALDLTASNVVQGEEPEYEEVSPLAPTIAEMFRMVIDKDPSIEAWV